MFPFLLPSDVDFHLHGGTASRIALGTCSKTVAERLGLPYTSKEEQRHAMDLLYGCMLHQEPLLLPMLRAMLALHKTKNFAHLKSFVQEFMPTAFCQNVPAEWYEDENVNRIGATAESLIVSGMADELIVRRLSNFVYGEEENSQAGSRFMLMRALIADLYGNLYCKLHEPLEVAALQIERGDSSGTLALETAVQNVIKECSAQSSNPKVLAAITAYRNEATRIGALTETL